MQLTRHADTRCRQRGYKTTDVELIERYGTLTGDGIYLRRRDVERAIRAYKRRIADLQRLEGTLVVVDGAAVITVQRAKRWKERRVLRNPACGGPRKSLSVRSANGNVD